MVKLKWSNGSTNEGRIVSYDHQAGAMDIEITTEPGDPYGFELGPDGRWYEINNSCDPVEISSCEDQDLTPPDYGDDGPEQPLL